MFKKIRYFAEYLFVMLIYLPLRFMPWWLMRFSAWQLGFLMHLLPGCRKLVRANIHAAMPELPPREVNRIARSSFDHLTWNLLEYFWCIGNEKRIRRCCYVEEETLKFCHQKVKEKKTGHLCKSSFGQLGNIRSHDSLLYKITACRHCQTLEKSLSQQSA